MTPTREPRMVHTLARAKPTSCRRTCFLRQWPCNCLTALGKDTSQNALDIGESYEDVQKYFRVLDHNGARPDETRPRPFAHAGSALAELTKVRTSKLTVARSLWRSASSTTTMCRAGPWFTEGWLPTYSSPCWCDSCYLVRIFGSSLRTPCSRFALQRSLMTREYNSTSVPSDPT